MTGTSALDGFDLSAGYFYAPTVIEDIDVEDELWKEEVFGPILRVCRRSCAMPILPAWFDLSVYQGASRHSQRFVEHRVCGAKEVDGSVGMHEVKSEETFYIPIVGFGKFLKPSGPRDGNATATEIVTAFKEVGCVSSAD